MKRGDWFMFALLVVFAVLFVAAGVLGTILAGDSTLILNTQPAG